MTSNKLVLGLAAVAMLALASCSAEPSDWRDDKKVSVDSVPPGTRESDNFDQHTAAAPSQHKGGAIEEPISENHEVPQTFEAGAGNPDKPSAEKATSANSEEAAAEGATQHDLNDHQASQGE